MKIKYLATEKVKIYNIDDIIMKNGHKENGYTYLKRALNPNYSVTGK